MNFYYPELVRVCRVCNTKVEDKEKFYLCKTCQKALLENDTKLVKLNELKDAK